MAIGDKKKKVFGKVEPVMTDKPMPPEVRIRAAENGFIVHCDGGEYGYIGSQKIAKSVNEAVRIAKAHLADIKDDASSDEE